MDVQVTNPIPGSRGGVPLASFRVSQAKQLGRAAKESYNGKVQKYGAISARNSLEFLPIIFETTGRIEDRARAYVTSLAAEVAVAVEASELDYTMHSPQNGQLLSDTVVIIPYLKKFRPSVNVKWTFTAVVVLIYQYLIHREWMDRLGRKALASLLWMCKSPTHSLAPEVVFL